jgi:hypothetical protein
MEKGGLGALVAACGDDVQFPCGAGALQPAPLIIHRHCVEMGA